MSAKILAEHCAATLAGIKTGNLFRVSISGPNMLRKELRKWNRILNGKGLRLIPVRYGDDFALLYLYRQEHLMRDLRDPMALDILRSLGYRTGKYSSMVAQLVGRMRKEGFPHEVGLFLGYPPSDVMGFLTDGYAELLDGIGSLKDGIEEFDREGIQELSRLIGTDLKNIRDRFRAAKGLDGSLNNFSGIWPDQEGSVRFLFESDAI